MREVFGTIGRRRNTGGAPAHGLGGRATDAYSNVAARQGFATPSVAEGVTYTIVRWSNDYWLLLTLFRNHWISRRIVEAPAQDMMRAWPRISSGMSPDNIAKFNRTIERTGTRSRMLQALKWGRLYGGAGALIVIEGHENILDKPLDYDDIGIGAYKGLIPFDRWTHIWPETQVSSDLTRPNDFGLPEMYRVTVEGARTTRVHSSRILRFVGPDVPQPEYQAQSYWGISVLEPVYDELKKRDNLSWAILQLAFRANIFAQVNPELASAASGLGMSNAALQQWEARLEAQNQLLSNQGMMVLPKDGSLQNFQYSFGGMSDVYQQFQLDIAGAAQMPVSRLFGRTITGLGQSNDADERIYEERIAQVQHDELKPQLDKLFPVVLMSEFGQVDPDFDYDFPSIRVLTEEDKVTVAKSTLDTVQGALDGNLLSQKGGMLELKQSSLITGIFTNIRPEDIEAADEDIQSPREMAQMAAGMGEPGEGPDESGQSGPDEEAEEEPEPKADMTRPLGEDAAGQTRFAGVPVAIEVPRFNWRVIRNEDGRIVYRKHLAHDYGYIVGTVGRDGDEVDVILGPEEYAPYVYVIDMVDLGPDVEARENEDKVMLGFPDAEAAKSAFCLMYPEKFFGGMRMHLLEDFRDYVIPSMTKPAPRMFDGIASFEENKHPRAAHGETGGQFVKKGQGGGGVARSNNKKKAHNLAQREQNKQSAQQTEKTGKQKANPGSALEDAPADRAEWPEHIKALKLPPAWKDVRINPNPDAALLAIGKDMKGRPQYVYSERFAKSQAAAKFARIKELDAKFGAVQKENDQNLKSSDATEREHAAVMKLIMSMGIRPGSEKNTGAEKQAYGATTLKGQHVVAGEDGTYLRFTGKKGVALNLKVLDQDLAKMLKERADKVGLDGQLFPNVSDKSLLKYTHGLDGGKYKTKDFRTLLGTREAMVVMGNMESPTNEKNYQKAVKSVAKLVSDRLGNTPTIALASYISPVVFAQWRANLSSSESDNSKKSKHASAA